ncbi:MAG: CDP-alcohol phosphatidyltransferase family protein [Aquificae bacterium]|nr:CDP-alcohol phosphatidyltransferase family protein [Aquificota bacterium]
MSQIIKQLKPVFEEAVSPVVNLLYRLGITPNQITVAGVVFVGIGSYFLLNGDFVLGALFLIGGNLCDAIDGALARRFNRSSVFGAFLDSLVDRISDFLPVVAVGFYLREDSVALALSFYTVVSSFLVSYARARAEGLGIDCKVGIMERAERSVILILTLLLDAVHIGFSIISAGATITVAQRVYCVYKKAR